MTANLTDIKTTAEIVAAAFVIVSSLLGMVVLTAKHEVAREFAKRPFGPPWTWWIAMITHVLSMVAYFGDHYTAALALMAAAYSLVLRFWFKRSRPMDRFDVAGLAAIAVAFSLMMGLCFLSLLRIQLRKETRQAIEELKRGAPADTSRAAP